MKKVIKSILAGSLLFSSGTLVKANPNNEFNPIASNLYPSPAGTSHCYEAISNYYSGDNYAIGNCIQRTIGPAIDSNHQNITTNATTITNLQSAVNSSPVQAKSGSTTTTVVGDATLNILEIGTGKNPPQIHQSGMSVNGENLLVEMPMG